MGYHAFCKFLLFAKWRKRNFADYFRSADIYNRHSLSFRDFLYFLAAMEPSTSHTYSIGALRCAYIFRFYNEDGDGKLKPDQFANFLEDVLEVDAGTTFPTESSRVDLRKNCWKTLGVPDTHEFSLTEFQEAVDTLQLEGIAHIFRGPVDICKDTLGAAEKRTEDALFDMFKNKDTGVLSIGVFLSALRSTGLRKSDPRLKEMMDTLKKVQKGGTDTAPSSASAMEIDTTRLDLETFRSIITPNISLISRAFKHQFIIPEFQEFCRSIEETYWKCKENTKGQVATYIPQLKRMSAKYWGVSVCTIDGQRFSIGDVNIPFTIQSCSKPLTYGIALDVLGADVVHKYVGQEPSGRMFNELVLDGNKKPHNPMINAGAILICSLLKTVVAPEMTLAEKFDFTMNYFERLAGREDLGFNNAVFLSEREAADRNYALGFYMRENKCFPENCNFKESMDFYFQCCSLEITCDNLAIIGSTLANGGICPLTEEKVLKSESVRDVLSLMHSCGMYDYSGQFAFKVGLPAKSGVSGALMVVIPNVMGICCWCPALDAMGNSCRGVQFCEELVKKFNFHRYDNLKFASNKTDPRKHKFETKGMNVVNLLFSAASGDLPGLRRHKLSGMDMTLADYDGRTALHLAAAEGHLSCVEFLLKNCDVPHHARDRWGRTALEEAIAFGHTAVINFLQDWEERLERTTSAMLRTNDSLPDSTSGAQ